VIYRTVGLSATASGTYMLVTLGRFSSVDPADQTAVDELDIRVLDHESGAAHSASMTGTACPTAGCSTGPPSKQWKGRERRDARGGRLGGVRLHQLTGTDSDVSPY